MARHCSRARFRERIRRNRLTGRGEIHRKGSILALLAIATFAAAIVAGFVNERRIRRRVDWELRRGPAGDSFKGSQTAAANCKGVSGRGRDPRVER